MDRKGRRGILLLPVIFLLISAFCLGTIDRAVGEILTVARTFRLMTAAGRELPRLTAAADALERRIHGLNAELEMVQQRQPPSIEDVKTIAADNSLRIDRIERLRTKNEQSLFPEYRLTFHGSVGGLARLLRDLEEGFICGTSRIDLWPYSMDGSAVAMSITIATREQ